MSEDYSQPGFYRFNEDSIRLIKWIQESGLAPLNILDLGAGSGILGVELAKILTPQGLTLVEMQAEFLPHLEMNCSHFLPPSVSTSIVIKKFSEFSPTHRFDLIVCNPPYYLPGRGEVPKNLNRAFARSFLVDSWAILLGKIAESLSIQGKAFIVLKHDENLQTLLAEGAREHDLVLIKHELQKIVIVELFRLNKDGN